MAYADPSTFVAGAVLTAAQQNVLANNDRFLHGPPTVRVRSVTATTVSASTAVLFTAETYDTDTMWSSTAARRLDINTPGKYLVGGTIQWESSTAGSFRELLIRLNGGTTHLVETLTAPPETGHVGPRQYVSTLTPTLSSTNYLELIASHDAGVALDVQVNADSHSPQFWAVWQSS